MTKKDYIAFAEAILWAKKAARNQKHITESQVSDLIYGINLLESEIMDVFKKDNSRFDREKFLKATEEVGKK